MIEHTSAPDWSQPEGLQCSVEQHWHDCPTEMVKRRKIQNWKDLQANHLKVTSSQVVAARCAQLPRLSKVRGFQGPVCLVASTRTFQLWNACAAWVFQAILISFSCSFFFLFLYPDCQHGQSASGFDLFCRLLIICINLWAAWKRWKASSHLKNFHCDIGLV